MNYIIQCGRNYMAISNSIEADCHKHWLLQMFLSSQEELHIEVNGQLIHCNAICVNMDTLHTFNSEGVPHFTILIDPTTEIGCVMRSLLMDRPFYIFPQEKYIAMQRTFKNVLEQKSHDNILSFAQSIIFHFAYDNAKIFDERVMKVLNLLDDRMHEDESQKKYFSKNVGLSESRLAHLFKEETGIPLKSYIVLHKLQRAYESIFNGENITTAALNAGFDSSSHLAYTNKMMTGMSASNIIKDSEFLKVF
jgi:AraC-like DNA-binding protein